jgi:hypothetical protein
MDERTKLIDWSARNHETKWAALQWLYDAAVAAERERCVDAALAEIGDGFENLAHRVAKAIRRA